MKALAPGVLPGLLQSIYKGRKTGTLRVVRGEERRGVRFRAGHIVHGEATVEELRLGRILLAVGRIDEDVLERAVEVMRRDRRRLGAVLIEMGIVDDGGLEEALALHARAVLTSMFTLRDGDCDFQEHEGGEGDRPLAVSTAQAVMAAVRALRVRDDVRFALGDLGRVLTFSDEPLVLYQRMDLGSADAMVLSCVDGARAASEVLAAAGLPAITAERSLLSLLCTGLVEYTSDPPRPAVAASAEQLRREVLELHDGLAVRSDHEVLGVPRGASPGDLKAAYFRLSRRYHPDVTLDPAMADLRDELEAAFRRVRDAYRALGGRPRADLDFADEGAAVAAGRGFEGGPRDARRA